MMMRSSVLRRVASYQLGSVRSLSSSSLLLPSVTLYQYNICPYCHKTKAVLGYAGIVPDAVIEVNPLTKVELPSKDYRKVPIAIVDGQQVNGSDAIINALLQNEIVQKSIMAKSPSLMNWNEFTTTTTTTTTTTMDSNNNNNKWINFANTDLAALLYPNICATLSDSYTAFGYVKEIDSFTSLQKFSIRIVGSFAMYMAASRIKAKRGITDERAALQEALMTWQTDGLSSGSQKFASGSADPNLSDLAVYGTLRSVEGLPAFRRIMEDPDNVALAEWYLRVKDRVC